MRYTNSLLWITLGACTGWLISCLFAPIQETKIIIGMVIGFALATLAIYIKESDDAVR